jgi:hypothetical protein
MQTFFRCEDDKEERADMCLKSSCKKRVTDMHHEVKHQTVITYYALVLGQKIGKEEARRMMLTRKQFLEVHECQLFFDITYVMFDLLMYQLLHDVQVTPWWSTGAAPKPTRGQWRWTSGSQRSTSRCTTLHERGI